MSAVAQLGIVRDSKIQTEAAPPDLPRHNGQHGPPPDGFALFLGEPVVLSDRFAGGRDYGTDFIAVFHGSGGGLEVPINVGLFTKGDLEFLDGKAALLAEEAPLFRREESIVAGVAEFLHLMEPRFSLGGVVRDGAIDDEQPAAGFKDTRAFPDERPGG